MIRLWPCLQFHVNEAVAGRKPPAGKGVLTSMLS